MFMLFAFWIGKEFLDNQIFALAAIVCSKKVLFLSLSFNVSFNLSFFFPLFPFIFKAFHWFAAAMRAECMLL